jgi:hypothetical protein
LPFAAEGATKVGMDAVDIDRKLSLTAAALGAHTRKELAAAFRKVNPRTSFDVERANKWLQGRARPRERQIYDDWALVLDVGRSGAWIADCDFDSFVEVLCDARDEDPEVLLRRARTFGRGAERAETPAASVGTFQGDLAGSFVCYSRSWSPYFRGRLIRGALTIARRGGGFAARYVQSRVQERIEAQGSVDVLPRALMLYLREPHARTAFMLTLFPPMSLVSVLGGLIQGPAVLGVDPQPSVSRIVMVRVPELPAALFDADCLLRPGASVAADLAELGTPLADPAEADRLAAGFLAGGPTEPDDHVSLAAFRGLVEYFDREWIRQGFPGA